MPSSLHHQKMLSDSLSTLANPVHSLRSHSLLSLQSSRSLPHLVKWNCIFCSWHFLNFVQHLLSAHHLLESPPSKSKHTCPSQASPKLQPYVLHLLLIPVWIFGFSNVSYLKLNRCLFPKKTLSLQYFVCLLPILEVWATHNFFHIFTPHSTSHPIGCFKVSWTWPFFYIPIAFASVQAFIIPCSDIPCLLMNLSSCCSSSTLWLEVFSYKRDLLN